MRTSLMICTLLAMRYAAADVSHLNMGYLPPKMMMMMMPQGNENGHEHMMQHPGNNHMHLIHGNNGSNVGNFGQTKTTIEKQMLQELPEQIEYTQPTTTQYDHDESMMMNEMMHNHEQMMLMDMDMGMPSNEMLPPPPPPSPPQQPFETPMIQYLPPARDAQNMRKMPAQNYLPPMMAHQYQPSAEMMAPDMPEIEQQQMLEYSTVEESEPAPAHMLTSNGYQYKTSALFPTPMIGGVAEAAANNHRYRFRK